MLNLGFERSRRSTAGPDLRVTRGNATILIEVQRRWYAEAKTWQRWLERCTETQPRCFVVISTHARQLRHKAQDYPQFGGNVYFLDEAEWRNILPTLLTHYLAGDNRGATAQQG